MAKAAKPKQEAAAPVPQAGAKSARGSKEITVSRGFADWLGRMHCSIAFTSYQTGQLFLIGRLPDGRISLHQQNYTRAMGVHATPQRLYLGSLFQVWRLENVLAPDERANGHFDRLFIPRNAQTTGDIDIHELAVDRGGRVIFVNTKFSCLATPSTTYGFTPIWKPEFISRLAAEDRCHLNGLAMQDGVPAYVTAVSRSDVLNGWRDRRHQGGVLIEVATNRVITDQLSMPHSPRATPDGVWLLDSGRGKIVRVDPHTGARTDVAFCPGFLRGLALHNGYALVTVSKPRDGAFSGLELEDAIKSRDGEPWCGVCVVDQRSGDIVEWIRIEGEIKELFDIAVIPGVVCPMAIGLAAPEMQSMTSFDAEFGPLIPAPR